MSSIVAISRGGVAFYNPANRKLWFHGFALLNTKLERIEVFHVKYCDAVPIGNAEIGIQREDVFSAYPQYGRKDSGFIFQCSGIEVGWHDQIRIDVIDEQNVKISKAISITPADYEYTDRKKKFLSFSQDMEDLILYHALQGLGIHNGMYVDVGANDPWKNSVTKIFSLNGWKGINIDPLPDKYKYLCLDRCNDINVNCGISSKKGLMKLYCAGGRSSFDETEWDVLREKGFREEIIDVPVQTLSDLLEENSDFYDEIHFLKIDVEGLERDVLMGAGLDKYRPYIIVVEATLPGTDIPCADRFEDILLNNNYLFAYDDRVNRYYVRKENKEIQDCFLDRETYKQIYEIYKPVMIG